MLFRTLTAISLIFAAGNALADDAQMHAMDKQQFVTFDAQVKADFQDGVKYKEISLADQDKVLKTLTRMEDRWQHADPSGKLNVNDTIEMANDQEVVTTILHHAAADSRVICDREVPMGSKIAKNVCRTVAEVKREQDESQNLLRDEQSRTPINHPGGG